MEQIRTRAGQLQDLGKTVPTDIHVLALGEPKRRDVTKVGGVPYRPRAKPWPETSDGKPMTFLAQFRFAESKDIVGDLPGDILLVFAADLDFYEYEDEEQLKFEWYPLGLRELIRRDAPVFKDREFVTCYGVRHRTVDFLRNIPAEVLQKVIPTRILGGYPIEFAALQVSRLAGVKTGGLPMYFYSRKERPDLYLPGRFLCSIGTIIPMHEQPFPWHNRRDQIPLGENLSEELNLEVCDGFVLNMAIDDSQQLHWALQSC